jgi:hypothetical protein
MIWVNHIIIKKIISLALIKLTFIIKTDVLPKQILIR